MKSPISINKSVPLFQKISGGFFVLGQKSHFEDFSNITFLDIPRESRLNYCQDLVIKKLPDQNYVVLKYLMEFLCLVTDRFAVRTARGVWYSLLIFRCDMNKMTAANLAVVFGPNLAWPNDKVNFPQFFPGIINHVSDYVTSIYWTHQHIHTISHRQYVWSIHHIDGRNI